MTRLEILFCLLLAAPGCAPAPSEDAEEAPGRIRTEVAAIRRGEIAEVIELTARTQALSTLRLASPVAGRIAWLEAHPGDRLAAGAVAARVIPAEDEAANRGLSLLEAGGALSPNETAATRRLRADLDRHSVALRVPSSAIVAERAKNPGEQVATGEILLTLFDPSSLALIADLPVDLATRMRSGLEVEIVIAGTASTGHVSALVPTAIAGAPTLPLRILPERPLEPPLLDVPALCRITLRVEPRALLAPRSALIPSEDGGQDQVVVVAGGRAARHGVSVGIRHPDVVEILDGLEEGQVVVARSALSVPDGTLVETGAETPAP